MSTTLYGIILCGLIVISAGVGIFISESRLVKENHKEGWLMALYVFCMVTAFVSAYLALHRTGNM